MVSDSSSSNATQNATQKKNTIAFTDVSIRNLKPQVTRIDYSAQGLPGLGIRVSPKGRKTFFYYYRFKGIQRRLTLGRYPELSLREARKKYAEAAEKVEYGEDPSAKAKVTKKNMTLDQAIDRYEQDGVRAGKLSIYDETRMLRVELSPKHGRRYVSALALEDFEDIFDGILKRRRGKGENKKIGSPSTANHLRRYSYRLFEVVKKWKDSPIKENPLAGVQDPAPEYSRERALSFYEIYVFLQRLPLTSMNSVFRQALKMMLFSFQRGAEVRQMEEGHLNRHDAIWTIPGALTKNKREWRVPLNRYAIECIEETQKRSDCRKKIFSIESSEVLDQRLLSKALRKDMACLGLQHFTPHDLRRTAATSITSLGCPRFFASLMLNHSEASTTSIYDQYQYDFEKRMAVDVWEFALDRILEAECPEDVPSLEVMRGLVKDSGILRR